MTAGDILTCLRLFESVLVFINVFLIFQFFIKLEPTKEAKRATFRLKFLNAVFQTKSHSLAGRL